MEKNTKNKLAAEEIESRDNLLKKELSEEKIRIIEKFGLHSTEDFYWISKKENTHEHIFFKHSYCKNSDIIHILFRINRLCFAKVKYFSNHADNFEPYIYNFKEGFQKTELWNADFLKHKASGLLIDLRYLQTITDIEKFKELCAYLESFEK